MKRLAILLLLNAFMPPLQAAVVTVSNNPSIPAQYTGINAIQLAHNAASAGDTLLIAGCYNMNTSTGPTYTTFAISKKLTLIGPGYNPSINNNLVAQISANSSIASGGAGTVVDGLHFYTTALAVSASNVTVRNSYLTFFNVASGISGVTLLNSIIRSTCALGNAQNILIQGNLFFSGSGISNSSQSTVTINQNVFISNPTAAQFVFSTVTSAVVTNNIFYGVTLSATSSTNLGGCFFHNNLTYLCGNNTLPPANATGSGNISGQNPAFISVANPGSIDYTYDYRLSSSSPGHNAGTGGADIGVYGGSYPMKIPPLTGMPSIPYITRFDVLNTTVFQGTNLNIHVKARKAD